MNSIQVEGPVFNSQEDEALFFQCIYNLPGYEGVVGRGTVLTISFTENISTEAHDLIKALCTRWETTICG